MQEAKKMMRREFIQTDLDQCISLFISVFNEAPWRDKWTDDTARRMLSDIINTPNFLGYVYLDGEEIIGFIFGHMEYWHDGNKFYLKEMCVKTNYQNKGIGGELINYLHDELKKKDISCIYLLTAKDSLAESFYKKNDYFREENMILMLKSI
ncbi:Acetyltransferase (GNAT) domain-containing protein [Natronincola peptidivorans]|uniref:Acetyltransferase (GNAT) domain-containing protein n=1 Tax=Natronincola peptidivorans TaxID=426128 RepID=A0A1I0CEW0_9FIRM|nr:GNAT family N-acetyltransferase [Natronincola peptidivorans]SET18106.1 Acetyltransferase (GNAT) domain-containing protein [Natronincola peptidivorans]